MAKHIYISIVALILCAACKPSYAPDKYGKWLNDPGNGLVKYKDTLNYRVSVQYRPAVFIAAQEVKNGVIPDKAYPSRVEALSSTYSFVLRFTSLIGKDPLRQVIGEKGDYADASNYLAYEYKQNIRCVADRMDIPVLSTQFINYQGVSPYVEFIVTVAGLPQLGFEELSFRVNDNFFTNTRQEYTFSKEKLTRLPALKL